MTRKEVYDRIEEVLGKEGLEEVLEAVKSPPEEWMVKKFQLKEAFRKYDVFRPESIDAILEALRQSETGEPTLALFYENKIKRATTFHDLDSLLDSVNRAEALDSSQRDLLSSYANYRYAVLVCRFKNKTPQPVMTYREIKVKGVERRVVWAKGRRGIYAVLTKKKAYKIK
jgi:hypothetical protein